MGADTVAIRVMRAAGLVCDTAWTSATNADIDVVNMGDVFEDEDSLLVYIEGDPGDSDDDRWVEATTDDPDDTTCQGRPAQTLSLAKLGSWSGTLWDTDTPSLGALLRSFTIYTYGLDDFDGEPYLVRNTPGGTAVPLVGPVAPGGVSFTYLDAEGNVTTVAAEVAQIVVTLRTVSEARDNQGNQVADSLTTRIYTRN
jgi:hypothetical protein